MKGVFHAWLFALLFWTGLSLGSVMLLMIHHLTGGKWGFTIRRILEAGMTPLPLMGLLFLPIFFGLAQLYPWAREAVVMDDEILQHRQPYMNETGFILRTVLAFVVWSLIAWRLRRLSLRQDKTAEVKPTRSLRRWSGPALVVVPLVATLVYLDWVMSLEKHWYSTVFMILLCVGQTVSALCACLVLIPCYGPLQKMADANVLYPLGNLLLAVVILWAYLMFSQFLIIWMGNLPDEIGWYLHRVEAGWGWVIGVITLFHFAIPLLVLLSRQAKKRVELLRVLAAMILIAQVFFCAWLVLPSTENRNTLWLGCIAFPLAGAFWAGAFLRSLRSAPLLVKNDPRQN